MRIALASHVFAPSVGGIETMSAMLAAEFVRLGHDVKVLTATASPQPDRLPYELHRRPSFAQTLRIARWCDVFFHNNISLARAWPLLFARRPWVVAHHVWIPRSGAAARAKRFALRFARGISISRAIAAHLNTPSVVIPNPYDDETYRPMEGVPRERDLIFVGRLVSDKGADLLLEALALLAPAGLRPALSIVGSGPEEEALRRQCVAAGLTEQVRFTGRLTGSALAREFNGHRIVVVPSRWEEPFGLVALEGIACGCVAVGSAGGGLADAIGPCGLSFPNGDAGALARALVALLRDPRAWQRLRAGAPAHLARHARRAVASAYLEVFRASLAAAG
jgi:glycosyltransferase involved in cell wall biosynthesis